MSIERLDKFLAMNGLGTRSEVKKLIRDGKVTVDDAGEKRPERKIDGSKNKISVNGRLLEYQPFICLMFHKPAGCVTAAHDRFHRTVMDYISHERGKELFPVGRLDLDTEGLLLLMNDGDLAHRILAPGRHVEKTYFVRVEGTITEEDVLAFAGGVDIGEKRPTLPASMKILRSGEISEAELTVCEGKFHQVKRMFAAREMKVVYLKRIRMAGICLDESLLPGQWRELTEEETKGLFSL